MQVYGIDLSMEKFDVNFVDAKGKEKNKTVKNDVDSISEFLSSIPEDVILCAEHTGVYGDLLVSLCSQMEIPIALVPGYTIKHSLGLVRGKSDPLDSGRIREYGERFSDKLVFSKFEEEVVIELKQLNTLRAQLVKERKALLTSDKGRLHLPLQNISVHNHLKPVLLVLDTEIAALEVEIEELIKSNQDLKENYELVKSIKGIGPVIATDLLIKTGNFKSIDTARKAASYAGVCPFPNSSGKMAGKSKTSSFADKKLKSLLHMGARSAVKHNIDYNLYYKKKKLEGKPHYLIMNNISNKMLRTAFSVVKNKTPYSQDHICIDPRERNINSSTEIVA
ncbi:MAG: IS110 family transposase [Bacteroides sp.]|nr:IS110 family transposase [Bacteroides sp.]